MFRRIRFRHVVIFVGVVGSIATSESWQLSATSTFGPFPLTASSPMMRLHFTAHVQPAKVGMSPTLRVHLDAADAGRQPNAASAFSVTIASDIDTGPPPCPPSSYGVEFTKTVEECFNLANIRDFGFAVVFTRTEGIDLSMMGKIVASIEGDGQSDPPAEAMISLTQDP